MNVKLFKYQQWHLLMLLILLSVLYFCVKSDAAFQSGEIFGIKTLTWLIFAIASPVVHQLYVLLVWRLELYNKSISNLFGKNAFSYYKIGFSLLILSRLITIVLLAISNSKTLCIDFKLAYFIVALLAVPVIYLFYSVKKYFGMDRAYGIDHFNPEKVKQMPFVKQGVFKYTNNGMYLFGFFVLWIPAFIFLSKAALLVALFNHLYIWVHYYFTELPDIKYIYKA